VNDIEELKQYVGVHARGQRIAHHERLLARISSDGEGPGSWVGEWGAEAARLEQRGRHLDACRHYIMARFPYPDGPLRDEAYRRSLAAFDRWREGRDIHRLDLDIDGATVGSWQSGLSTTDRRPLLIVMGGIVSVKEQWAPALTIFRRLGLAAIAIDMPGAGENPLSYGSKSSRLLSSLLDAVADRADVSRSYALALSFSGHLALRCAVDDSRIRGVLTAGAPISEFFTDADWRRRLPRLTVATLAHLTDTNPADLEREMPGWALPTAGLAALTIPVAYVASRRDEIIPPGDPRTLRENVHALRMLEHDDVHGAPTHVAESQAWLARELVTMRGDRGPRRMIMGLMWWAARIRAARAAGRRSSP
jgi:esterase FrsA